VFEDNDGRNDNEQAARTAASRRPRRPTRPRQARPGSQPPQAMTLDNGAVIRCTLGGQLRRHKIRVLPQDRVRVAITPYQLDRGFITFRYLD
jgi:translation initiation factor IF-1